MTKHRTNWIKLISELRHTIKLWHSNALTADQAMLLIERSIYLHVGPKD